LGILPARRDASSNRYYSVHISPVFLKVWEFLIPAASDGQDAIA
jgi:hypothetical protein